MRKGICMLVTISVFYQFLMSQEEWVRTRMRGRPKDEIHTKGME